MVAMLLMSLGLVIGLPDAGTATVKGMVTDINDGEPIEGAEVTISYHSITRTDVTDSSGAYMFNLDPECYCLKTVKATKDGYRPESKDVGVSGVTVVDFELLFMELEPYMGTVMGTVTDNHDGQPISSARVELEYHETLRTVFTDTSGEYRFDQVPECFCLKNISVSKEGYIPQSTQVGVAGETVVDFALLLEELPPPPEEGTIMGVVTDYHNGQPISGAHVTLEHDDVVRTTLTDSEGKYRFDQVPECRCLKKVSVSMAAYIPQSTEVSVDGETIVDFALWIEEVNPPPQEGRLTGVVTE